MSDAKMMRVKEAAERWNLTERRVSALCKEGRISGAQKAGKSWLIPIETEKPYDSRIKSGKYRKYSESIKLPLPLGVSDYRLAASAYYYVDKTLLIKDLLDERPLVTVFTRPRQFGKTMNLSMLQTFFEKTDEDTSVYFQDKKIWECGERYQQEQGKYPVIFLNFKDVKFSTWENTFSKIRHMIAEETRRILSVSGDSHWSNFDQSILNRLCNESSSEIELTGALSDLTEILHRAYGVAPILLVDNYDVPIQQINCANSYRKLVQFLRNLFAGGMKDNPHLSFAVLTGILHPGKYGLFDDLGNASVYTVLDHKYSSYFGFTEEEIRSVADYYNAADRFEEIRNWYGGCQIGRTEIFQPWSTMNYLSCGCEPRVFWQTNPCNRVLTDAVSHADREMLQKLIRLLNGNQFAACVDTGVSAAQILEDASALYSYMLMSGYLKSIQTESSISGDFMCQLALPNQEVSFLYRRAVLQALEDSISHQTAMSIQEMLYINDRAGLQEKIPVLLTQMLRASGEVNYPKILLGLCALFSGAYTVNGTDNGSGRFDVQMKPKNKELPGILIGFRTEKNYAGYALKQLAETALKQLSDKKLDAELSLSGVKVIYKYGVAFSGKNVELMMR